LVLEFASPNVAEQREQCHTILQKSYYA
jgi:hypothetical protein